MQNVYKDEKYEIYEYCPTIIKPLAINFEPMRFVRRIRFLKSFFGKGKYKVYYLKVNGEFVGHCVIQPGGKRLKCSTEHDIVIGPYFIKKESRGKGYSVPLVKLSLDNCSYPFIYAYDWIEKTNQASIATSERVGFIKVGELNVTRFLRRLIEKKDGDDYILRYENGEN